MSGEALKSHISKGENQRKATRTSAYHLLLRLNCLAYVIVCLKKTKPKKCPLRKSRIKVKNCPKGESKVKTTALVIETTAQCVPIVKAKKFKAPFAGFVISEPIIIRKRTGKLFRIRKQSTTRGWNRNRNSPLFACGPRADKPATLAAAK